jgi:hypothetical protein
MKNRSNSKRSARHTTSVPSAGARPPLERGGGGGGPYSDFYMYLRRLIEKPKTKNGNPHTDKRPGSAVLPRSERPSEAGWPAAAPAEGMEPKPPGDRLCLLLFSRTRLGLFVEQFSYQSNQSQYIIGYQIFWQCTFGSYLWSRKFGEGSMKLRRIHRTSRALLIAD